jgi:hypothetical protein
VVRANQKMKMQLGRVAIDVVPPREAPIRNRAGKDHAGCYDSRLWRNRVPLAPIALRSHRAARDTPRADCGAYATVHLTEKATNSPT